MSTKRKTTKPAKPMSLRATKTLDEVCSLKRDNLDAGAFWILADHRTVTLAAQKRGEKASASVTIPKRLFNRLVDFYQREQPRVRR